MAKNYFLNSKSYVYILGTYCLLGIYTKHIPNETPESPPRKIKIKINKTEIKKLKNK